jgi:hypothetical protein
VRGSRLVALSMLATATLSGGAGTARADTAIPQAASSPQRICGYGYYVQRWQVLPGAVAYLLFNGVYNCAVTIKTASLGIPTRTSAGLQVRGSSWAFDTGSYRFYAGPVKQHGRGKCVRYFGYHGGTRYISPWGNCG